MENLNNGNLTIKRFSKKIWFFLGSAAILIAITTFLSWYFLIETEKKQEILNNENVIKSANKLKYFASIYDTERRALSGAHEIWTKGKYAYVTTIKDNGIEILDISDPANPQLSGVFFDNEDTLIKKAHTLMFKGKYGYLSASQDGAIQIFDFSDPINPVPTKHISDDDKIALQGVHEITLKGNYLYAAAREKNAISIFDVSDPSDPKFLTSLFDDEKMAMKRPEGLLVSDKNFAYIMSTKEGLEILNVSDPANPIHVASLFDSDELLIGGLDGMALSENYLYLVGKEGLSVFDILEPANPKQIGKISIEKEKKLSFSNDIRLIGNNAIVASEAEGGTVLLIDISNPTNPVVKDKIITDDTMPFLRGAHNTNIIGNYIYVTGLQDGIGIIKISE